MALALVLAANAASALDADAMEKNCVKALATEYAACVGYVSAIMDVLRLDSVRGFEACLPRETSPEAALAAVADYVRRNPAAGAFAAAPVVAAALAEAFPCKGR